MFSLSRITFRVIFSSQNARLLFGNAARAQLCPCQKQPLTNITALYFGNTRSGCPGRR